MPVPKYAARVDANQAEVIDALRAIGVHVTVIGEPVDLAIGYRGRSGFLEVKDGSKPPSARKLKPSQAKFQAEHSGFFRVVTTPDEAIRAAVDMAR